MLDTEWAYLAGIVDGEGSVTTTFNSPIAKSTGYRSVTARLYIGSTDKTLIDWIINHLGGNLHTEFNPIPTVIVKTYTKTMYKWYQNGTQLIPVLEGIIPYMIIKKTRAELSLELLTKCRPGPGQRANIEMSIRAYAINDEMRLLNKKGV